jgi:hypothetical protein
MCILLLCTYRSKTIAVATSNPIAVHRERPLLLLWFDAYTIHTMVMLRMTTHNSSKSTVLLLLLLTAVAKRTNAQNETGPQVPNHSLALCANQQ